MSIFNSKLTTIILFTVVCITFSVLVVIDFARAVPAITVDLFYEKETDTLRIDRYSDSPIQEGANVGMSGNSVNSQIEDPNGPYKVEILKDQNTSPLFEFRFQPKNGAFSILIPKLPNSERFRIIQLDTNKVIVSSRIEEGGVCNMNNICEFEQGENKFSCYSDCTRNGQDDNNVQLSKETKQKLQAQNGVIRSEEGTVLLEGNNTEANEQSGEQTDSSQQDSPNIWFLIGGIVLFIGAVGSWIYLRFVKDEE